MNYIREAENRLLHYRDLQRSINNANREIAKLVARAGPSELSAAKLDETGIHGDRYDETINVIYQIQRLNEMVKGTLVELEELERLMGEVSQDKGCELYGMVLRRWYIEGATMEEIGAEIGYSSRQSVYDIRNPAIRKFAVELFGIEALKAM